MSGKDGKGGRLRPLVLVCGSAQAGKTALIRAVSPKGTVPESAPNGKTMVYETDFSDFADARGRASGESILDYLMDIGADLKAAGGAFPDCIWYCHDITDSNAKEEEAEVRATIRDKLIFACTKADKLDSNSSAAPDENTESAKAKPGTVKLSTLKCRGLDDLMRQTLQVIIGPVDETSKRDFEEKWRKSIAPQQKTWQESIDRQVDSLLNWAACRAFAVAIIPLPLADVGPLIANEAYMIYRIGSAYGYTVDKSIIANFLGCAGASVAGLCLASFLPFLKAPIAAGITYAVGCAANAWFKSGMKMSDDELRKVFADAKADAKNMSWRNANPV